MEDEHSANSHATRGACLVIADEVAQENLEVPDRLRVPNLGFARVHLACLVLLHAPHIALAVSQALLGAMWVTTSEHPPCIQLWVASTAASCRALGGVFHALAAFLPRLP